MNGNYEELKWTGVKTSSLVTYWCLVYILFRVNKMLDFTHQSLLAC